MHLIRQGSVSRSLRVQLRAPRVVTCGQVFEHPWGEVRVHYVALGDRSTSVAVTATERSPGALTSNLSSQPGGRFGQIALTDDQGRTEVAQFSGGTGRGVGYRGRLTTMQPLSQSTKWIDVATNRVDLMDDDTGPPTVAVESLPPQDDAERYLWSRLSSGRHGPMMGPRPVSIDRTIDTLIACGALSPENPIIDDVRAVFAAFTGHQARTNLPQPWASLLNAGFRVGPEGMAPIGAVTPPINGTVMSFEALVSSRETFEVHLTMSPNRFAVWGPGAVSVGIAPIAWWAMDDLQNHYLGAVANWGGSGDVGEGTVSFWPALDPLATHVRLMPTGATERGVVTVGLPIWSSSG
jgi:hypothetical protein